MRTKFSRLNINGTRQNVIYMLINPVDAKYIDFPWMHSRGVLGGYIFQNNRAYSIIPRYLFTFFPISVVNRIHKTHFSKEIRPDILFSITAQAYTFSGAIVDVSNFHSAALLSVSDYRKTITFENE